MKYVSVGLFLLGIGFLFADNASLAALSWSFLAGRCAAIDFFAGRGE